MRIGWNKFADVMCGTLVLIRKSCCVFSVTGFAILLLSAFALAESGGAQCPAKAGKQRVVRKDYENLQRWVNQGHQPWRLDARPVAGATILEVEGAPKGSDAYQVPLRTVTETHRSAIFEYYAGKHLCYVVTLRRYSWLLPLAKKWDWMVWAPTDVSCAKCELTPGGNISGGSPGRKDSSSSHAKRTKE